MWSRRQSSASRTWSSQTGPKKARTDCLLISTNWKKKTWWNRFAQQRSCIIAWPQQLKELAGPCGCHQPHITPFHLIDATSTDVRFRYAKAHVYHSLTTRSARERGGRSSLNMVRLRSKHQVNQRFQARLDFLRRIIMPKCNGKAWQSNTCCVQIQLWGGHL